MSTKVLKSPKKAFTLAEVLLTLAIIGVVAALTIPALQNSTSEKELFNSLKKAYSTIGNATRMINAECGDIRNCFSDPNGTDMQDEVADMYMSYTKNIKECAVIGGDCFADVYEQINGASHVLNNIGTTSKKFVLSDGSSVVINFNGYSGTRYASLGYFYIRIDINGLKGPNKTGHDLFWFSYDETTQLLHATGDDKYYSDQCSDTGRGCAAKVLLENAINY